MKKALPKSYPTAPSEEFMNAVCHSGGIVADCELCGRVHFTHKSAGYSYDPGEYESLEENAKSDPERYIEADYGTSVSYGRIDGKQVVFGCPCNLARKYEDWIVAHRHLIRDFLCARAEARLAAANGDHESAKAIEQAITDAPPARLGDERWEDV